MSAQAPAVPAGDEAAPKKKGKKKLILILALVFLLLGGGGAAYYFLAQPAAEEADEEDETADSKDAAKKAAAKKTDAKGKGKEKEKKKKKKKEKAQVEFMTIEPWFTFNLMDKDPERSGQIGLVFEVSSKKAADELKFKMPVVRSRILFLISGKFSQDIKSPEGKEQLREELLTTTRAVLDPNHASGIENVHFSIFVVQ